MNPQSRHEAVAGEEVAIARHGKVVAYVRPAVERSLRQPPHELVREIMARARKRPHLEEPAVDIIRRMRDGEWGFDLRASVLNQECRP